MTGIEILASEEILAKIAYNYDLALFVWAITILIGVIIGSIINIKGKTDGFIPVGIVAGIMIGFLGFIVTLGITKTPTAYETQYKVTISDEVSMNDFYEHYEVIEQDGKIFIVRERN